jgi:hypothetical protein
VLLPSHSIKAGGANSPNGLLPVYAGKLTEYHHIFIDKEKLAQRVLNQKSNSD